MSRACCASVPVASQGASPPKAGPRPLCPHPGNPRDEERDRPRRRGRICGCNLGYGPKSEGTMKPAFRKTASSRMLFLVPLEVEGSEPNPPPLRTVASAAVSALAM